jgi:hypothetical protein
MKTTQLAKDQKRRREARAQSRQSNADIEASAAAAYALLDVRERVHKKLYPIVGVKVTCGFDSAPAVWVKNAELKPLAGVFIA